MEIEEEQDKGEARTRAASPTRIAPPVRTAPRAQVVPGTGPAQREPAPRPKQAAPSERQPEPMPQPEPEPEDNLIEIEGIGPKTAGVLNRAGIRTFSQLAEIDLDRLKEILREGELRSADPTTWPEQAALAARGDWDGLLALRDQLKGGRRVR